MTARRQPSSTSLSNFTRANPAEFSGRSPNDFCNAFWGSGDGGFSVLSARMRGAMRTMEELKNFWKERAIIEEQYARRLSALAQFTLGKDEINEAKVCLDSLRLETDRQAGHHMTVATEIRNNLEPSLTSFLNKQVEHKRTRQAVIEKAFKTKQTREGYVNKAKEKYEGDCLRINSYTAQATLSQGRDLEKIQQKLERARQTVQANERDFANFARAFQDTVAEWERDWKEYCDRCQDLEEDRLDFLRDHLWAYANAISTVCVSDDQSCERLRQELEQMDTERDIENFIRDYGTGNAIPDPPQFVNYANPDAVPPSSQRASSRPAKFTRIVQRQGPPATQFTEPEEPQPEPEPINITGVGAGGGHRPESMSDPQQTGRGRSQSRASTRQSYIHPSELTNGHAVNGAASSLGAPPGAVRPPDPHAEPINAATTTMLKVGDRAYEVDLTKDPQARGSVVQNGPGIGSSRVGQNDDPLAIQMEQLRNTAGSSNSGSVRRSQQYNQQGPQSASSRTNGNLSPPPGSRGGGPPNRDYRLSAEIVVGAPPPEAMSRPTSRAPSPVMMVPAAPRPGSADVRNVLDNYEQSLPGERKSVSRPASRTSFISPTSQPNQQPQNRRLSTDGHAGIGAQGRSTSPQPYMPQSRGASPQQIQQAGGNNRRNSYRAPVPGSIMASSPASHTSRQSSISIPQVSPHQQRPTSPNSVGIALGPDGRVVEDSMADRYKNQQYGHPGYRPIQQQPPPPTSQPPPPPQPGVQGIQQQQQHLVQRTPSYPPPTQPPYGAPPPAPSYIANYQQPPPPVGNQPQPPRPSYIQQQQQQRGPEPSQYGPPVHGGYQPQPVVNYNAPAPNGPLPGAPPNAYMNYGQPPNGQVIPQPGQPQQIGGYPRAPSPARSPQPQQQRQSNPQQPPPTGQYTEDGRGVLFYVKALYDYQATIEEEFDFQMGDIIAVTDTPEDGWWSGELLDEARRQPGRTVFPSNFVCLF
ncbi:hypothetical protein QCA50_020561 [Cerrena zonata]|uniref:SH3 domain-containing protein n=1 Tax=Cerrena zonata TaxID=2478898 RepID=A0AAW0FC09_9APHY